MSPEAADKVCPLVVRLRAGRREVLAFRHPLAGCQLVKGTPRPGESLAAAAARELFEESGVRVLCPLADLGRLRQSHGAVWAVFACAAPHLPDRWAWRTRDDHGHVFRFFWQPLGPPPGPGWHRDYRDVLAACRISLRRIPMSGASKSKRGPQWGPAA